MNKWSLFRFGEKNMYIFFHFCDVPTLMQIVFTSVLRLCLNRTINCPNQIFTQELWGDGNGCSWKVTIDLPRKSPQIFCTFLLKALNNKKWLHSGPLMRLCSRKEVIRETLYAWVTLVSEHTHCSLQRHNPTFKYLWGN